MIFTVFLEFFQDTEIHKITVASSISKGLVNLLCFAIGEAEVYF